MLIWYYVHVIIKNAWVIFVIIGFYNKKILLLIPETAHLLKDKAAKFLSLRHDLMLRQSGYRRIVTYDSPIP